MSIKYFDFQDNLTEQSPKNNIRPFKDYEAYALTSDGVKIDNPEFILSAAKSEKNKEQRKKRQERFSKESDKLLLEIQAMQLLGQNISEKKDEWIIVYNKIKSDLPLVS